MQKYQVMVRGRNLLKRVGDGSPRLGFYCNVFVEASTPADAADRAVGIVREDAHLLEMTVNAGNDPVHFSSEEVRVIESFDGLRLPRQGLIFYPEKSKEA